MGDRTGTASSDGAPPAPSRVPVIQLPKGGGAIRGVDEKLAANPATGSASLTVPIPASPGRAGAPALTLSYDSASGNGPFGLGWSLSLPAISRKTAQGLPRYRDKEASDTFVLSGAEDLVPVLAVSGDGQQADVRTRVRDGREYRVYRYRPRIEGLFARIERWRDAATGDTFWRSISRDNITTLYGLTADSRVADPEDSSRVFSWLICESFDDKGNATRYQYKPEDGRGVDRAAVHERNRNDTGRSANRYLKRVLYGNRAPHRRGEDLGQRTDWMFEVLFDYGEHVRVDGELLEVDARGELFDWPVRRDPFSTRRAGFEVRTYRLCRRVLMLHHFPDELGTPDYVVRTLHLRYREDPVVTCLEAFTQTGTVRRADGTYRERSLPPLELEYSRAVLDDRVHTPEGGELENLLADPSWIDLDGEGLSGLLAAGDAAWRFQPNLGGGRLGYSGTIDPSPATSAATLVPPRPADLAGDGRLDLVRWQRPVAGFFERGRGQAWSPFAPIASNPNLDWGDPDLRLVDLTGGGHADVLLAGENALHWHRSLGEGGFAPASEVRLEADEERSPRLLFSDAAESIFLADLSGDGLSDLVRIRNGEVCYWPSLGYGRFGRRVTMDDSPWFDHPELFDPRRVRLADVDGSGIADLLYLGRGGVAIYLNLAGNGWSAAQALDCRPGVDDPSSVGVLDLLGTGTACLVWSDSADDSHREVRYVDLMSGVKPHLLVGVRNNLGAEKRIAYAPSTSFQRADREAGRPWITRLPFPVWVVERVTVLDRVSRNRFTSRYAYHHGAFDGEEREFRGFGMVEQWDAEEVGAVGEDPLFDASNEAQAFFGPAVLTRTWFHTGVRSHHRRVSRLFEDEYTHPPGADDLLPDTVLPPDLSPEEERQAVRALKGSALRTEVYALDGTAAEGLPYTISEQNQAVALLQALGPNRHAVFFTHPRESLTFHSERRPADPRIAHSAVLEVDDYGNVLASAQVAYGRRRPDPELTAEEQSVQARTWIVHGRRRFTHPIDLDDDWRAPRPCEAESHEITGLEAGSGNRFALTELTAAVAAAAEIPYQAEADGTLQKRLIEGSRTLYRRDDLTAPLPLGQLQPRALPFESYALALTPGLLEEVFGERVDDRMLVEDGGYVRLPESDGWWIPSGRVFFAPGPNIDPADELDEAREHFFLPRRAVDPFGNAGTVRYDPYDLLVLETADAVGNRVTAGGRTDGAEVENGNDYRVLAPVLVTDANGNRSAVAFDALGLVAGTAVMGKPGEDLGDRLDGFLADLPEDLVTAFFRDPLADPQVLLGSATTRFLYDLSAFSRTGEPTPSAVGAILRETHGLDLEPGARSRLQLSFSYSDGFGREIQKKSQAEPGPLDPDDPTSPRAAPRWVATGWTIFNNKGKPVREYEPFFDDTHTFRFGRQVGVSPTLFYDPVGRVVATLRPDHTFEKVVFDAWSQTGWDVGDTVLVEDPRGDPDVGAFFESLDESDFLPSWHGLRAAGGLGAEERDAAVKAAAHAETPFVSHLDALGRSFVTVADTGGGGLLRTVVDLDVTGRERAVVDARGRTVMVYDLDVAGRPLQQRSMEAGVRRTLADAVGQPLYSWDDRGHRFHSTYDAARRPTGLFVRREGEPERQLERFVYGEAEGEERNLRGRLFRHFDGAGLVTQETFDFKGNLLHGTRRLARRYRTAPDWSGDEELEDEVFEASTAFDALDRPITSTTPDGSTVRTHYNEAGLVERVEAELRGSPEATVFVRAVEYDAKGRRTAIEHGNGVRTTFDYDPLSSRLRRKRSSRGTEALQDLRYAHDPAGNVTSIRDAAQQTIFFNNQVVEPHNDYTYDALYRLVEATGREHVGDQAAPSWDDGPRVHLPHPHDGNAMRRYRERYEYDAVGNLLRTVHQAPGGNWTRAYDYEEPSLLETGAVSNRLSRTRVGELVESYSHDPHGNMTSMAHLSGMEWDARDQLSKVSRQVVGDAATPETTYYAYGGGRVRKVRDGPAAGGASPTRRAERIYLGPFEVYREYAADGETRVLERETLRIGGDAVVETGTIVDGAAVTSVPRLRYQLSNHLGSVALEVDEEARVISYEEYTPYGSTSYQAGPSQAEVSAKRYRYSGKERDEESGFTYHGARYYAPWLGRWTSSDPAGVRYGLVGYEYSLGNPIGLRDDSGQNPVSAGIDEIRLLIGAAPMFRSEDEAVAYGEKRLEAEAEYQIRRAELAETLRRQEFFDQGKSMDESVPLFSFFIPVPMEYVRSHQQPPSDAPHGFGAIRQMNGQPAVGVANFSRDHAPGTHIANLTALSVEGLGAGSEILLGAARLGRNALPETAATRWVTSLIGQEEAPLTEAVEIVSERKSNLATFTDEFFDSDGQLLNQTAKGIRDNIQPEVGHHNFTIGLSVGFVGDEKLTVVTVSDPKAWDVLNAGALPEGMSLGPRPELVNRKLPIEQHVEHTGPNWLADQGAKAGMVGTSSKACKQCSAYWDINDLGEIWHTNRPR